MRFHEPQHEHLQVQRHSFNCPYQAGSPKLHPHTNGAKDAEVYELELRENDLVLMATDGIYDNLWDYDLEDVVSAYLEVKITLLKLLQLLMPSLLVHVSVCCSLNLQLVCQFSLALGSTQTMSQCQGLSQFCRHVVGVPKGCIVAPSSQKAILFPSSAEKGQAELKLHKEIADNQE